jgi:hypothetical protein
MNLDLPRMVADPICLDALAAGGWQPDRVADPSDEISALEAQGFAVNDHAVAILKSFIGLTVRGPAESPEGKYGDSFVEFLPFDEADGHCRRIRENVEPITGESVFPLGGIGTMQILLVGESGQVYSDSIDKLFHIGDNFDSALYHVLLRDEFPKLMWSAPGSKLPWWINPRRALMRLYSIFGALATGEQTYRSMA